MPEWGTASLLEIIFTFSALIGLGFAIGNEWRRWQILIWLRENGYNGLRRAATISRIWEEAFAIGKLVICIIIGVAAMTVPTPHVDQAKWVAFVGQGGICLIVFLIITGSIRRYYEYGGLMNYIVNLEKEPNGFRE